MLIALYTVALMNASPAQESTLPNPPSGWSLSAGIVGIAGATSLLSLALTAERHKVNGSLRAIPFGIATLTVGAVAPPLVWLAGWGGRRSSGARGSPALRVAGWITYGALLTVGGVAASFGLRRKEPINGLIALMGGFGALSLSLFAGDAFVTWRQARTKRRTAIARRTRPAVVPWVAPVYTADHGAGAQVGVAGWF